MNRSTSQIVKLKEILCINDMYDNYFGIVLKKKNILILQLKMLQYLSIIPTFIPEISQDINFSNKKISNL